MGRPGALVDEKLHHLVANHALQLFAHVTQKLAYLDLHPIRFDTAGMLLHSLRMPYRDHSSSARSMPS